MSGVLDVVALGAVVAYAAGAGVLTALGLHSFALAVLRMTARRRPLPVPSGSAWPSVVVQLPVYDEPPALVARALDAALAFEYPGRVEIQLLDDSPAASRRENAALCAARRGQRHAVRHLPRERRDGFKAGALAAGLRQSSAPFAAVFDVDFRPAPDLLRSLIAPLVADGGLAFVQAPWTHPDAPDTWLARAQDAVLDVHFVVDQAARDRAGLPVLFNGSGGVWRVAAITDAGGWRADTLAEDLDLTVRAYARGWRSRLAEATEAPADLPSTTAAWRRQQARWAKGLAEVARLHTGTIWRSRMPLPSKLAFTGHLALSWSFPASFAVILLHPVVAALAVGGVGGDVLRVLVVGYLALLGLVVAHLVALRVSDPRGWGRRLVRIPAALSFPVGLLIPAGRGVAEAALGRRTPFVRTPKDGARRGERGWGDMALAAYSVLGLALVGSVGAWGAAVFQALLALATTAAALSVRRGPLADRSVLAEPVSRAAA